MCYCADEQIRLKKHGFIKPDLPQRYSNKTFNLPLEGFRLAKMLAVTALAFFMVVAIRQIFPLRLTKVIFFPFPIPGIDKNQSK